MRSKRLVRFVAKLILLLAAALAAGPAWATGFSIDHSDIWWVPGESGWGLQVVQQANVIFATMYVYDPQNDPVWYSATLDPVPGGARLDR